MSDVVYLLGAGASHACALHQNSKRGLLMSSLAEPIRSRVRKIVVDHSSSASIVRFVNDMTDDTDIEHVITFFEDSNSSEHKRFANDLRGVFFQVLQEALDDISDNSDPPSHLYAALVDMHAVEGADERLRAILTLNYDTLLEHAITQRHDRVVDYGLSITTQEHDQRIPVIKLHGSLDWTHTWPVHLDGHAAPSLSIPPGIQKARGDYPFNLLWGLARQTLDCDIIRIIGCNLGPNDWELVSLLFSAKHTHSSQRLERIEVIDFPSVGMRLKKLFPYLDVLSLLDLSDVGPVIVGELLDTQPMAFDMLSETEQMQVITAEKTIENPLWYWLRHRAELWATQWPLATERNYFKSLLESP